MRGDPRRKDKPKTPGAEIHARIETETWSYGQGGVTLNIWDVGGQEMLHGRHRFCSDQAQSLFLGAGETAGGLSTNSAMDANHPESGWGFTRHCGCKQVRRRQRELNLPERQLKVHYPNLYFHKTSFNDDDASRTPVRELQKPTAKYWSPMKRCGMFETPWRRII